MIIFLDKEYWISENYTLSPNHTVFQCEAHALHRAGILLQNILSSPNDSEHRVIIYTDSQALIKALSKSHTSSKTICQVHNTLNTTSSNHFVSIEWVPGHEGHQGNESADKLANIRNTRYKPDLENNIPPSPNSFFKHKIKEYITQKFRNRWSNSKISENTKEIVSAILERNLHGQHLFKLGTDILRPLTRLITGHNNLNHFQNKINFTTAPFCSFCEDEVHETALHLICNCEYFANKRMQKFGEDPITIDQAMRAISLSNEENLTSLLEFIGDAAL